MSKRLDLSLRNKAGRKSITDDRKYKVIDLYLNTDYGFRDIAEKLDYRRSQYTIIRNTLIDNNIEIKNRGCCSGEFGEKNRNYRKDKRCDYCGETDIDKLIVSNGCVTNICKDCKDKKTKQWRIDNRDLHLRQRKNNRLKSMYGITLEQYNDLLNKQNHRCAVCGKHESNFKKGLCVDHDHESGKIRKLLCTNCNSALGQLKEDPRIVLKLLEYINDHTEGYSQE